VNRRELPHGVNEDNPWTRGVQYSLLLTVPPKPAPLTACRCSQTPI